MSSVVFVTLCCVALRVSAERGRPGDPDVRPPTRADDGEKHMVVGAKVPPPMIKTQKVAFKSSQSAQQSEVVANTAATRALNTARRMHSALEKELADVLDAQKNIEGLSREQTQYLKNAEEQLRYATKDVDFGKLKQSKYVRAESRVIYTYEKGDRLQKIERTVNSHADDGPESAIGELQAEVSLLRSRLETKCQAQNKEEPTPYNSAPLGSGSTFPIHAGDRKVSVPAKSDQEKKDAKICDEMDKRIQELEAEVGHLEHSGSSPELSTGMSLDEAKVEFHRLWDIVEKVAPTKAAPPANPELEKRLRNLEELQRLQKLEEDASKRLDAVEAGKGTVEAHRKLREKLLRFREKTQALEHELGINRQTPWELEAEIASVKEEVGHTEAVFPASEEAESKYEINPKKGNFVFHMPPMDNANDVDDNNAPPAAKNLGIRELGDCGGKGKSEKDGKSNNKGGDCGGKSVEGKSQHEGKSKDAWKAFGHTRDPNHNPCQTHHSSNLRGGGGVASDGSNNDPCEN